MKKITIFGQGNMGSAIGARFQEAGHEVAYVGSSRVVDTLGDMIVLAVPYAAVASILATYAPLLTGKVIVDITNPVDFATLDGLVVPTGSSAAEVIAQTVPSATVVKAFNTNFAATLGSKEVAGKEVTTVLLASDSDDAKALVSSALTPSGLVVLDAGSLKRARELEAMGFLQITLAIRGQIGWTGGFAVIK